MAKPTTSSFGQLACLTSLNLLPRGSSQPDDDTAQHACPVCGSALAEPDPTPSYMRSVRLKGFNASSSAGLTRPAPPGGQR